MRAYERTILLAGKEVIKLTTWFVQKGYWFRAHATRKGWEVSFAKNIKDEDLPRGINVKEVK